MKYFVVYLFLEVIISVNISSLMGGLLTFVEIVFTAFLGIAIIINYKNIIVDNLSAISSNYKDLQQLKNLNLFVPIGAVLLIMPGFFTDGIGVILQFSILTNLFVNRYNVKSKTSNTDYFQNNTKKDNKDVIDVEIITKHDTIK